MDNETIETNLAGLHFMEKLVQAILSMKSKIRYPRPRARRVRDGYAESVGLLASAFTPDAFIW